jgi:hypothetical protein
MIFRRKNERTTATFKKTVDNLHDPGERVLNSFRGSLPGRSPDVTYQYSTLRIALPHHIQSLRSGVDTHQFVCVYRNAAGEFKYLFEFKTDCRLNHRIPDLVAIRISDFLTRLLTEAVRSEFGIRAIVVCQESASFWLQAFESRIKSLSEEYERSDRERM